MITYSIIFLLLGLVLLIIGGDLLVRGAVSFANIFRVPSFLIGVTVVSFGTSAPELMVSIQAALDNVADIAIGNVMGSNIANIALVLGISVIIKPIINLLGMGINSIKVDNDEEFMKYYNNNHFWCEFLEGEHNCAMLECSQLPQNIL